MLKKKILIFKKGSLTQDQLVAAAKLLGVIEDEW